MHLTPQDLVDLAEGTRSEASAPHLATCERCRREFDDLRQMLSVVADTEVPEPPAVFWQDLSANIHRAVAAERGGRTGAPWLWQWRWRPALLVPCAAAAAIVLAVVIAGSRYERGHALPSMSSPSETLQSDSVADDDLPMQLLGDLTENLDVESASEATVAPRGGAEHEVTHLNDAELRELRRLLQEAIANAGG